MCGISGIISLNKKKIENIEKKITLMNSLQHHRGPDDNGVYINESGTFALGNNRLSIVSPNEKIKLPFSKDNNNYLSFNGEIYNYKDLKDKLMNIKFNSETDTEVLYEFLKSKKDNEYNQMNGMWAFAFYNENNNKLILSRDLLGERHLFYCTHDGCLYFASEIQPLLKVVKKKFDINFNSLIQSWKYNCCGPKKTLIDGIFRLAAGENMIVKNGNIYFSSYNKFEPDTWYDFFKSKPSINIIDKKFSEIFYDEVNIRVPKDVGYFSTLSGGIDSSVLNFFLKKSDNINLRTFFGISNKNEQTIKKFNNYSDLEASNIIAQTLDINHSYYDLNHDIVEEIIRLSKNNFDGCIDSGVINFFSLAKYVKNKNSKVLIVADGPDEMLSGYDSDLDANKLDQLLLFNKKDYLFNFLKSTNLSKKIINKFLNIKKDKEWEISYYPFSYRVNHAINSDVFLDEIVKDYQAENITAYNKIPKQYESLTSEMDFSQQRSLIYLSHSLPDMFNLRLDKASMQNSVETRLPFQSKKIADFFLAMPNEFRIKEGKGKYYLRNFMSKKINKEISNREKRGMGGYIWDNLENRKELNMAEVINNTDFFKSFPFKKNAKERILRSNKTNLWIVYSLIQTFEELKKF